jgi:hypothetical protein
MGRKKIEESEENTEVAEQEQPKDIKLAEFPLKESAILLIKKTNYKGEDRIDFRVWLNSAKYKGPTKQGFVLTMDKIDAFIEAVNKIKEKLKDAK